MGAGTDLCKNCGLHLTNKGAAYCSNKCQINFQYAAYIRRWKLGEVDGGRGTSTRNLSQHVIRYIWHKYDGKCARCGWAECAPDLDRPPLEIDHIDGNSENNTEEKLVLLCPNCHSVTSTYKNRNKGNGRLWRKQKYMLQ